MSGFSPAACSTRNCARGENANIVVVSVPGRRRSFAMDQLVTEERIADVKRTEASAGTWSRVVRLIEAHPDVKQVRLNINEHSVTVGFYETPSQETLEPNQD